jgi:hypothetical protein
MDPLPEPSAQRQSIPYPNTTGASTVRRYFYVWMGVLAMAFVAWGFSYTYFIPIASGKFSAPLLYHIHGAMYFLWTILIVSQPLLVRTKNVRLHRQIGTGGFVLAAAMVLVGFAMSFVSAKRAIAAGNADFAYGFLLIPITDMLLFGTFIGLSLVYLKKSETHKRLMILATLSILPAAFGRIFGINGIDPGTPQGFIVSFLMQESLLIIGVAYDFITRRKVHPVYIWGGLAVVLIHSFRFPLGQTALWKSIAQILLG